MSYRRDLGHAEGEPSLHVLLGIPEDAGMTLVDRSYEQRRRELLEADPDWLRDEVRQLDGAYRRYLDAWRSRSAPYRMAVASRSDMEAREARNKARRDKAAARRAGERELRAELAAQGWPQAWPVGLCRAWQGRGGTLETAVAVDRAGWARRDVKDLISTCEDLSGVVVPDGAAEDHLRLGDTLADLVDGSWPAVPPGALLSVKSIWRDGRRERFAVTDQPAGRVLSTYARVRDGWTATDTILPPDGLLAQVVAAHPDLFTVPAGRSVEAWIDQGLLGDTAIRNLVCFPGDEADPADKWPEEIARQWAAFAEELEGAYPGLPWVHRWVEVNGDRVIALRPDPPTGALLPIRVAEDGIEFLETRSLASYNWYSEGAAVSWNGGVELVALGGGLLLHRTSGDEWGPSSVEPMPAEPHGLAARIADWVTGQQAGPIAALALEQLDPAGTLSARDTDRWDQALAEITEFGWCAFGADEAVLGLLRALLRDQDDDYRRAAAGLADPTSRDGLALLATLEDAVEHAATGDLQGGNWADPGEGVEPADVDEADEGEATDVDHGDPLVGLSGEDVRALVAHARAEVDAACEAHRVAQERDIQQRVAGRAALGVDESMTGIALWKAYQRRTADEPERDWEFKDAYHLLHDYPDGSRTVLDARDRWNEAHQRFKAAEAGLEALLDEASGPGASSDADGR